MLNNNQQQTTSSNYNNQHTSATLRNRVCVPSKYGDCCYCTFDNLVDKKEHFAIVFNQADKTEMPLVRMHSECITGDLFGSMRCDCGQQLRQSLDLFSRRGGILLYLRQEGRGIGLYKKLDAYTLQLQGYDTYEANKQLNLSEDLRCYDVAAQMLEALNSKQIRLLTNNPDKIDQLKELGIDVVESVRTGCFINDKNRRYLEAKVRRTNHHLDIGEK